MAIFARAADLYVVASGHNRLRANGACNNQTEEYFSRLRRAEIGIHHHIAGAYLLRYAQGSSWREDNRRSSKSIR
jgi:hypothetical protein